VREFKKSVNIGCSYDKTLWLSFLNHFVNLVFFCSFGLTTRSRSASRLKVSYAVFKNLSAHNTSSLPYVITVL